MLEDISLNHLINAAALLIFILFLAGYLLFMLASLKAAVKVCKKKETNVVQQTTFPNISIIIPSYNEELHIAQTVQNLMKLHYKSKYEIIVVDDGSTDQTSQQLIRSFSMRPYDFHIQPKIKCQKINALYRSCTNDIVITLLCKDNGGKADALNAGINASKYEYIVCMDADCVLDEKALQEIALPVVQNKHTIAVGGCIDTRF